jgi:uroporphyrinogen decarboxylase
VDCGLDVVNLQQPTNLGIEEMGRRYRGRICFESICDIQMTLPFGTEQQIRDEARQLLKWWRTPQGGFVLSDYGDGRAIGVSDDRKRIALQAFCEIAAPELLDRIGASPA